MRLDVTMCNINGIQIQQSPKHLIGKYFEFESGDVSLAAVFLDGFVEITGEIVHDYI